MSRPGLEKAAILLLGMGEAEAATVLRHLGHKEIQNIGETMAELGSVSQDQLHQVFGEFLQAVEKATSIGLGTDEYIRTVMIEALGEHKASGLLNRISSKDIKGLDGLKWMDSNDIADMIRSEHPQVQAIVLSYLDSDQAAEVMSEIDDDKRLDLMLRVAKLEAIQPGALEELNTLVEKHFAGKKQPKISTLGGIETVANILNSTDATTETSILDGLKESDADLAESILDLMFIFEDFNDVDDRSIQALLREIQSDVLLIALKGVDDDLKEKFFANMSKRAAELLRDDLEAKGPVRLSEVEIAQKEILGVARRMAEAGEIMLSNKGEEMI